MRVVFIIFVVTASLAESSFRLPAKSSFRLPADWTYGQSEEILATLNNIIITQKKAAEASFDSVNPLFDLIQKYASKLIYNLEDVSSDDAVTDDSPSELVEAILDGISLTFNTTISSVGEVGDSLNAYLVDGFAAVDSALELATTGNYFANKAQLESYRETAQDQLAAFIQTVSDLIQSLANTNDEEVLAVIILAQSIAANNMRLAINGAFNAIDIYGAAVTAGTADLFLIFGIESYRKNTLDGLNTRIASLFGLLRAHYIDSQLSSSVDLADLYANQLSQGLLSYTFIGLIDEYYVTITTALKGVALGLQDSGRSDFSPANASAARALATFNAGNQLFLDYILVVHPKAQRAVADAAETLATISKTTITNIYDVIQAAKDPEITYSEFSQRIEAFRETISTAVNDYTGILFNLIRNGETWDRNSETNFSNLYDVAVDQLAAILVYVSDAIEVLAQAVDANEASESDFSAVQNLKAASLSAKDGFFSAVFAAGLVQLKAAA